MDSLDPLFLVQTLDTLVQQLGDQLLLGSHLMEKLRSPDKFQKLLLAWLSSVLLSNVLPVEEENGRSVVDIERTSKLLIYQLRVNQGQSELSMSFDQSPLQPLLHLGANVTFTMKEI